MNKIIFFLILLLSGTIEAQIVDIPDANFKALLLNTTAAPDGIAKDESGNSIVVDVNDDNEIQQSEALLVYDLYLNSVNITSLVGIEYFVNLEYLECSDNQISSLDVSTLTNLNTLECNGNDMVTLSLGNLTNLEYLFCYDNQLSALDVSGLANLKTLECSNNEIAVLDISGLSNLEGLGCRSNQITTLDFTGLENVIMVYCSDNQLTELDLSDTDVFRVSCANNNITFLNIKNGIVHDDLADLENEWANNPLTFVCADPTEVSVVVDLLDINSLNNVNLNSYCSFTPGGDYNTITGTILFDANNDGCDPGDIPQKFIKIGITDGADTGAAFTNSAGGYAFYTGAGNFTVAPVFENNYFAAAPVSAAVNFPGLDNSVVTEDFCITANGVHNDVEVVMVPLIPARPGFNAIYKIVYRNKGNQVLSGGVNCVWDYTKFGNINLVPVPNLQSQGNYTWYYTNLLPFENREILMTLEVNTPADAIPVNNGDILDFTATATLTGDEVPEDNMFVLNQVVVGSFNANNIICIEGETVSPDAIGDYLHYVVNFKNTGSEPANFIVVTHEINPADFDISSLQVLNSSHGVSARVTGNKVEFIFDNINLNAMDHGNILFKLKSHNALQVGDNVMNKASIFFDYNSPIETNDAVTVFGLLSTGDFEKDASVQAYPNPSAGLVSITADKNIRSIELYDIQGRLLQSAVVNDSAITIDISQRASGMYFLKIKTEEGIKVEKIVRK